MLVVGTEHGQLLFLHPSGTEVKTTVQLGGVPVYIICEGTYDIDYRCFVACRNGCVYIIIKDKVDTTIKIDSKPIWLARLDKSLVVGALDNSI